jgi:hypothetical protein
MRQDDGPLTGSQCGSITLGIKPGFREGVYWQKEWYGG